MGAATGQPPATSGRAIQAAVQAGVPAQLVNEARGLVRSRAARAHPVPKGKCNEVLSKLKHGFSQAPCEQRSTTSGEESSMKDKAADTGDHSLAITEETLPTDESSTTAAAVADYEDTVAATTPADKGVNMGNGLTEGAFPAGKDPHEGTEPCVDL